MKTSEDTLLNDVLNDVQNGRIFEGMETLLYGLYEVRRSRTIGEWKKLIHKTLRTHPIAGTILQSPLAGRAFKKPRGYPGDAKTIDYVYSRIRNKKMYGEFGGPIYDWEYQIFAARSVRGRCEILAQYIDRIAAKKSKPKMMSVACGHLREAEKSSAMRNGKIGQFIAFDIDAKSLAEVDRRGYPCVKTVHGSVSDILKDKFEYDSLDLVYAAGLYDYLPAVPAKALTEKLFAMLRPGGLLLIPNFAPNLPDSAYMEAFLDWHLIYRHESDMRTLAQRIEPAQIRRQKIFRDDWKNIVYLELTKN